MNARWRWSLLPVLLGTVSCSSSSSPGAGSSDGGEDASVTDSATAADASSEVAPDVGAEASDGPTDVAQDVAPDVSPTACGAASACDPLSARGCGGAKPACDVDKGVTACRAAGTASRGQACDLATGPACAAGLRCDTTGTATSGLCRAYCCGNSDCVEPGTSCQLTIGLGALGLCTLHAGTYLPAFCGVLGPVGCDPFSGAGCDASSSLCGSPGGGSPLACAGFSTLLTEGASCGPAVAGSCPLGTTCALGPRACRRWCCSDGDCDGGFSCISIDTANLGSLGFCD